MKITIILMGYSEREQDMMASILTAQDYQNFEILSATIYTTIDEILEDSTGDYFWILPRDHKPAQTQTIRKLNSVLTLQQPDMIIGSFAYIHDGKTKIRKQRHKKYLPDAPLSSYIISRQSLSGLEENLFIDDIELTALPRIIHCVNFPISFIDDDEFIPTKPSLKTEWNAEFNEALQTPFRFITSMMVLCGHGFDVVNSDMVG
jgi:hypothetical protein